MKTSKREEELRIALRRHKDIWHQYRITNVANKTMEELAQLDHDKDLAFHRYQKAEQELTAYLTIKGTE